MTNRVSMDLLKDNVDGENDEQVAEDSDWRWRRCLKMKEKVPTWTQEPVRKLSNNKEHFDP